MRKSFHMLSGIVNNRMSFDLRNRDVFIFINKNRNRIKLLRKEPGGLVIYAMMLDYGRFHLPAFEEGMVSHALVYIGDLYHVETLAKEAGMSPEGHMTLRKEKAYPQIRKFEEWIEAQYPYTTDGSLLRKAMEYTYKRLPKLAMYVNDGNWLIDNNLVENAIRPLALGRKNYLFCWNDASAIRASMMYSFIASCKANDIDPRSWFEDVIRRIPEYEYGEMNVSTLLPQHWSPTSTTPNKVG